MPAAQPQGGQADALSVFDPSKNTRFDETVKPIKLADEEELLYQRWVKSRRELVDKLSGGRLGLRPCAGHERSKLPQDVLGNPGRESGKQALIVDTRFNGGGNLHDELATLLSGHKYLTFFPRGRVIGAEPTNKWQQKSCVLMGESNYSDAHLFPWVYRDLGVGKLIGMPVPGTAGTAVWWETQIDPALYFGIPQVGFIDDKGDYMEHARHYPQTSRWPTITRVSPPARTSRSRRRWDFLPPPVEERGSRLPTSTNMPGCVLRVTGVDFDPAAFLATSDLRPYQGHRRGDTRRRGETFLMVG